MKKFVVFSLLIVVLAVAAGIFYRTRSAPRAAQIAALLPSDTVLFLHLPNLHRTRERWEKTALAQIAREPEVQAFLERPKSSVPQQTEIQRRREQIARINPGEGFLAVTSVANGMPKVLAGFSFHGKKSEVEALMAKARSAAQGAWPAGKSDLVKSGAFEIETFAYQDKTLATSYRKDWALISNDLELLKSALEKWDTGAGTNGGTLRESEHFKAALAQMPRDFDALAFAQTQSLVDIAAPLLMGLTNPAAGSSDPQQMETWRKIQAVSAAVKLEGENIHDVFFVANPDVKKGAPLRRGALAMSATDTMLYSTTVFEKPGSFQLPDAAMDSTGLLQQLSFFLKSFEAQGLGAEEFGAAFGPELSVLLGWPGNSMIPSLIVALDVRDADKAQRFLEVIAQPTTGGTAWNKEKIGDAQYYRQQTGGGLFQPDLTMALSGKFAIAGVTFNAVRDAVQRLDTGAAGLNKTDAFQKTSALAATPTSGFAYVDARALFERLYSTLRPFAMMWAGGAQYVDLSKLPATETIGKHLSPVVYSHADLDGGSRSESIGPVTMSQVALIALAGGAATAVSKFQEQIKAPAQNPGASAPLMPLQSRPRVKTSPAPNFQHPVAPPSSAAPAASP